MKDLVDQRVRIDYHDFFVCQLRKLKGQRFVNLHGVSCLRGSGGWIGLNERGRRTFTGRRFVLIPVCGRRITKKKFLLISFGHEMLRKAEVN